MSDYPPESGIQPLPATITEVTELRDVLLKDYAFDPSRVVRVINPTREQILDSLQAYSERLGITDNLLIVYSGHGAYDARRKAGFWLPVNARSTSQSSWIANTDLVTQLRGMERVRQVLVVADACFAGALAKSGAGPEVVMGGSDIQSALLSASRPSRRVMAAGTSVDRVPAQSSFSTQLIKVLREQKGGVLRAGALFERVRDVVARETRVTPVHEEIPGVGDEQGEFVFVRRNALGVQAELETRQRARGERELAGDLNGCARFSEALAHYQTACGMGDGEGCHYAGKMLDEGRGAAADPSGAMALFRKGCTAGSGGACHLLAQNLRGGTPTPAQATEALDLHRSACGRDYASSCVDLGYLYETGRFVSKSDSAAAALYRKGCELGEPIGCVNLGLWHEKGRFLKKNDSAATAFYRKACDVGQARGCAFLGNNYAMGIGITRDDTIAVRYYRVSCEAGGRDGCNYLGLTQETGTGTGTAKSEAGAYASYQSACASALADGCANLSRLQMDGRGPQRLLGRGLLPEGVRRRHAHGMHRLRIHAGEGAGHCRGHRDGRQALSARLRWWQRHRLQQPRLRLPARGGRAAERLDGDRAVWASLRKGAGPWLRQPGRDVRVRPRGRTERLGGALAVSARVHQPRPHVLARPWRSGE